MAEETKKKDIESQEEIENASPEETETASLEETETALQEETENASLQEDPENAINTTADAQNLQNEQVIVVKDEDLSETTAESSNQNNLDLMMEVSLNLTVELGRCEMQFSEILQLSKGSVIELNKLADEPVDLYVNQSKVAQGEVVVVDEHFGIRITKLINPNERIQKLG